MSDKHYVHPPEETELAKVLRQSRSWFEAYGTTLIYAVAGVLALSALVVYIQRTPPATAPASAALMSALKAGSLFSSGQQTPEEFQDIADQFDQTEIGVYARLRQADLLLEKGISSMFSNREASKTELESAQKAYERLTDAANVPADVRERVLAGLARLAEARCDGSAASTDAAIAAWKKVLEEFPDSKVFKAVAEARIKDLERESTRDFYAWFQQQNPKPTDDLLMPQDRPGTVPDIPSSFQLPDISIPQIEMPTPSGSGAAVPAEPGGSTPSITDPARTPAATPEPAAEPEKPAEEKPAEEKPAEEKPSEPEPGKSGE